METPYHRTVTRTARRRTAQLRLLSASESRGWLQFGTMRWRCAIGPSGVRASKREGDGATPRGLYRFRVVHYRPDRIRRPQTDVTIKSLRQADGWCDQVGDRNYNRPVLLPYATSHERLWRDDHVYDIVISLNHNERPRIQGHGSCVFLHIARKDYRPTAGCIALSRPDLLKLLAAGVRAIRCS
jgi:L,D-peptidoglycan transpeptidase YkuD (ErfK/YbiS/YcfS/YnhG family)